jgi:hypothetical protein
MVQVAVQQLGRDAAARVQLYSAGRLITGG